MTISLLLVLLDFHYCLAYHDTRIDTSDFFFHTWEASHVSTAIHHSAVLITTDSYYCVLK